MGYEKQIRIWQSLTLISLSGILSSHFKVSEKPIPKGVPLSRAALYDPQKDFLCLDGSKLISFSFVNDDYCDCPDGSDEPGTAACSDGRFFCVNAGHFSIYIPSSRVNDRICDCCDGSDESADVSCTNACDELGRAAREESERATRLAKDGYQKRLEMSEEGKRKRQEKEAAKSKLQTEMKEAERVKLKKQKMKDEAEVPEKKALEEYSRMADEKKVNDEAEEKQREEEEAIQMFDLLDSDSNGVLTVSELQVRSTFDRDKDGQVSEQEAIFFLNLENSMSREDWLKHGWLLAKPYVMMEKGLFSPPIPQSQNEESVTTEPTTEGSTTEEPQTENITPHTDQAEEDQDEENVDSVEKEQTASIDEDDDEDIGDPEEHEDHNPHEHEEEKPKYDEKTMELIKLADAARAEFNEADKFFRESSRKLQEVSDELSLDFGEDERFSPLHGQCFDFEDREYVYSLCPFKEASQRGKSSGSVVNLGRWGSWTGPEVEKHNEMLYSNGQPCWNGPPRSARILVECGVENRLTSVTEPSRCEYEFHFSSPAACQEPYRASPHFHEEL